jgi:thioredoxin:protein disulfide reductase
VVLIGVGLFYLSLAYKPELIYILVPLALVAGGIYLGFVDRTSTGKRLFPWIKRAVGVAAVVGGIMFYLAGQKPAIEWESYSDGKLSSALESGKPVVLYFSASWCIPCLELDRLTFTDETVIDEMSRFVLLKVDLTNFDSPESQELRSTYSIAGVPTIVFIGAGGEEVTTIRAVGFVPANDLLERVRVLQTAVAVVGAGDS